MDLEVICSLVVRERGNKGKVFPIQTTKECGVSRDIDSLALNFDARERRVDKCTPLSLYVKERTSVSIQ
jgi:hypothetical protein